MSTFPSGHHSSQGEKKNRYEENLLISILSCENCGNSFRSHLLKKEWGFVGGSDGKESICSAGDPGLIPVLGRSPGEGNGSRLQSSCLENPLDRGTWWATVHGVTKSQTQLND